MKFFNTILLREWKIENIMSDIIAKVKQIKFKEYVDEAAVLSCFITILYFWALYRTGHMTVMYDTAVNRSIANGDMIGYRNAHQMFINYFIGIVMSALYYLFPAWEWFTIMLLFTMYFSLWAVLYRVFTIIGNGAVLKQIVGGGLTVFAFNYFFYESLMSIYFLNCAAIAGVCAFFYLILLDEMRRRDAFICAILLVLCAGIRFSVFKEMLPFNLAAVFIHCFAFQKRKKRLLLLCGSLLIIIGLMYVVNENAYTGIYANEKEINHYRAAIQDYAGLPTYEGHEELYQSLGMNEDEYLIMKDCWGLSDHLDRGTLAAILEVNEAEHSDTEGKKEQIRTLVSNMFKEDYTKNFWLLEILCAAGAFLLMFRKKDWRMLLCYLGVFLIVAGEIIYLAYNGRMPVRVTISPLLVIMLSGIGYMIQYRSDVSAFISQERVFCIVGIVLTLVCIYGVFIDSENVYHEFENSFPATAAELKLVNYMLADSDNTYFCHGKHDELDLHNPIKRNYTGWGGWISETIDWRVMLLGDYGNVWDAIAYRDDLRFIVSDSTIDTLQKYLINHGYRCNAVCDVVDIDGHIYNVWRFENNN